MLLYAKQDYNYFLSFTFFRALATNETALTIWLLTQV